MDYSGYVLKAKILLISGGVMATTGGIVGDVLPQSDVLNAASAMPLGIALVLMAIVCFYIAYRMMMRAMDIVSIEMNKHYEALRDLSGELRERPCIRKPTNN